MQYALILSRKAEKALRSIDARYFVRVHAALLELQKNPRLGKSLKGEYHGLWSMQVWPYRVIYLIKQREVMIYVVDVGHRQGIYS
ncbi:MAG: type II toxin-antitoxin system RelE/ParE family toxin [Candidatus Kerfeldbacteria bacterium]|nr:type II toxin-antitoxin system RelE/ParE family toxin [Candidatus Kerfeldbacteria bacterium]